MFHLSSSILTATAFAMFAPFMVSAATVGPIAVASNEFHTFAEVMNVGDNIQFDFQVSEALSIPTFALSATGNNGGLDVGSITFGFVNPTLGSFDNIVDFGGSAAGFNSLFGGAFNVGDAFSVIFNGSTINDVSVTLSFETFAVPISAVPIPAAGGLLGIALLGTGFAARRRVTKFQKAKNQAAI